MTLNRNGSLSLPFSVTPFEMIVKCRFGSTGALAAGGGDLALGFEGPARAAEGLSAGFEGFTSNFCDLKDAPDVFCRFGA